MLVLKKALKTGFCTFWDIWWNRSGNLFAQPNFEVRPNETSNITTLNYQINVHHQIDVHKLKFGQT